MIVLGLKLMVCIFGIQKTDISLSTFSDSYN